MKTLSVLFSVLLTTTAYAQSSCSPREQALDFLSETYGEARQSLSLDQNNNLLEMFANRDSGSWTILITTTDGIACILAYGFSYEMVKEPILGDEL